MKRRYRDVLASEPDPVKRPRPQRRNPLHCLYPGCDRLVEYVGRHQDVKICYLFVCGVHLPEVMGDTNGVYLISAVDRS